MKQFLAVIMSIFLLITTASCSNTQRTGKAHQFYYRTQRIDHGVEAGIITSETRYLAEDDQLMDIISVYLGGPVSENLVSPFPADLRVINLRLGAEKVELVLSDHIATQSGIELTATCACIQRTLSGLTGINTVHISAENEEINNQDIIVLKTGSIILIDEETKNPEHSEKSN